MGEPVHFRSGVGTVDVKSCYDSLVSRFNELAIPGTSAEIVSVDMNNRTQEDALVIKSEVKPVDRLLVIFKLTNIGSTCLFSVYKQVRHLSWVYWVFYLRPSFFPVSNINGNVNSYLITEEIRGLVGAATSIKGSMRMRNYLQMLLFKWQQPKLFQLEHFQALNFACDKLVELGDSFIH